MRVPLVVIAILVAGCVQAPGGNEPQGGEIPGGLLPFPDPMVQDHDHKDPKIHAQGYQFAQTAWDPLAATATHGAGVHALDAKAGWLFAAVYGGDADAEGGLFIFNLSDPQKPALAGRYQFPGQMGGDRSMEATEDGNWVVLGTEPVDCAGHVAPAGPGIYLIDVRDKANPTPAFYLPNSGTHSITIHRIDGEDYVFGLMPGRNILRIVTEPVPRLEEVGEIGIGHDAIVMDDPLLGVPLLYAANGEAGFTISDVSDPTNPKQIAEWNIPDRGDRYYVHTGAVAMIGGKRIVVVTSEDFTDYPSALWVLDASDFQLVETLTQWSAPGDHAAEKMVFSMHNPRFLGDDLILSYYHAGVWSLDLADPAHPRIQGLFVPGESTGYVPEEPKTKAVSDSTCPPIVMAVAPNVMDVETWDGAVYAADMITGLYALAPRWT